MISTRGQVSSQKGVSGGPVLDSPVWRVEGCDCVEVAGRGGVRRGPSFGDSAFFLFVIS